MVGNAVIERDVVGIAEGEFSIDGEDFAAGFIKDEGFKFSRGNL